MQIKFYIKTLRDFRIWHRYIGLMIAILIFVSALTGVFLALKKDIDLLQPPTQKGVSKDLKEWKPLAELATIATAAFYKKYPDQKNNPIDKMDVRPQKGVVKVLFEGGWWEVQIDGASGEVKSIARRHSDWIEALHDGSIISDGFKLVSMNVLGFGLLFMLMTGLWLYYGPKRYRLLKKKMKEKQLENPNLKE